jgi:hypothetical protein
MDQRITMSIVFGKSVKPGTRSSIQPPAIAGGSLQLLLKDRAARGERRENQGFLRRRWWTAMV